MPAETLGDGSWGTDLAVDGVVRAAIVCGGLVKDGTREDMAFTAVVG